MAFSFQDNTQKRDWFTIMTVATVFVFIVAGTYLLFFTEAPLIEVVAPPELKQVSELSQIEFDEAAFQQNETFNSLRRHVSDAQPGESGRENPFARF